MPSQSDRPNVLIIIPHDLGAHLHCYGHAKVRSPHLDRFAAGGVRLANNFTVAPECTPSRASMFTGLYPHQHGLMGLCHRGWEYSHQAVHLAEHLRDAGYATHLFGFQHETGGDPRRLGYENVHAQDDKNCDPVSAEAVKFLQSDEAKTGPWFACIGFMQVHRASKWPADPSFTRDDVEMPPWLPDTPSARQEFARFYQCIENMDAAAGRVFDALRDSPMFDHTLAIFTTDHGIGFPRAKSTFFDPGVRTAAMLQWPRRVEGRRTLDEMITNIDLCPTVLEACDIDIPDTMAGRSYLPLLEGKSYEPHEAVFGALYYDAKYDPMHYVRTPRHKYIRSFAVDPAEARGADPDTLCAHACGPWIRAGDTDVQRGETWESIPQPYGTVPPRELYDLDADPLEQHNLAAEPAQRDVVQWMEARLAAMMQRTNSPLLRGHVSPDLSATRNEVVRR